MLHPAGRSRSVPASTGLPPPPYASYRGLPHSLRRRVRPCLRPDCRGFQQTRRVFVKIPERNELAVFCSIPCFFSFNE
ncbi:hypothetical protein BDA96_10G019300 [Sorghum bicolor]|uniref:Uncharacterized protein n=1 Tax=Sorghum bicolor TaxID=4558 RepID=A0A921TZC7_SORBI|nr:hypothetical protein BDA96_10G019300 [Sorghum bicolor]